MTSGCNKESVVTDVRRGTGRSSRSRGRRSQVQRQSRPAIAGTVEVVSVARSVATGARAVRSRQGVTVVAGSRGGRGRVRGAGPGRGRGRTVGKSTVGLSGRRTVGQMVSGGARSSAGVRVAEKSL